MIVGVKTATGHDLPAYVTPDGVPRVLGCLPGPRSFKAPAFGAEPSRILPRSSWLEIARHRLSVPIKDQGQESSCVANGSLTMVERAMVAAGMAHVNLSRAMLYALINGGRDAGSNPADAFQVLQKLGVCAEATLPYQLAFEGQITAAMRGEAARFKLDGGAVFECNSFDELVSAELQGYKTGMTVYVAGNYAQLDADGCPPAHRGQGNHWQSCDARIKKARNGDWLLGAIQSWGEGVWDRGLGYFREAHVDNQPGFMGYAILFPGQDPLDPNEGPILV